MQVKITNYIQIGLTEAELKDLQDEHEMLMERLNIRHGYKEVIAHTKFYNSIRQMLDKWGE